jgi:hypothetical protein
MGHFCPAGVGFGTAEDVFSGAQNASQTGFQIREMPFEQLSQSPAFEQRIGKIKHIFPAASRVPPGACPVGGYLVGLWRGGKTRGRLPS